jgi:hypothetical protein
MAQPQTYNRQKNHFYTIYLFDFQFVRVVAFWLRFGCVLVAFPYVGCARSEGTPTLAQPEAPVALLAQPLKTLNINPLNAKKPTGCAVAPKKYIPFWITKKNICPQKALSLTH